MLQMGKRMAQICECKQRTQNVFFVNYCHDIVIFRRNIINTEREREKSEKISTRTKYAHDIW